MRQIRGTQDLGKRSESLQMHIVFKDETEVQK